jgi:hypothetical protein
MSTYRILAYIAYAMSIILFGVYISMIKKQQKYSTLTIISSVLFLLLSVGISHADKDQYSNARDNVDILIVLLALFLALKHRKEEGFTTLGLSMTIAYLGAGSKIILEN